MTSLINGIRKILLNRNTVTILAVFAGVIVLWFFYNMMVNNATNPKSVPVATRDITATEEITKEDFEYVKINSSFLKKASVVTSGNQLTGYYIANGTSVVEGAMFYRNQVVTKDKLEERDSENIPDGYSIYWLKVDNTSTYANSIYPGDKIDLWLKASVNGSIVYDEFINSIDVLQVKDSNGQNVFDTTVPKTPAWLSFAVKDDMLKYFKAIENTSGMQLYPVPRNKLYTTEGAEVSYSNDLLKDLIRNYAQIDVDE